MRQNELFSAFKRLDRDEDGHLEFKSLELNYLSHLTAPQKSFFLQVSILMLSCFNMNLEFKLFDSYM